MPPPEKNKICEEACGVVKDTEEKEGFGRRTGKQRKMIIQKEKMSKET